MNDGPWLSPQGASADILADVMCMIETLKADKEFGPYELYLPTNRRMRGILYADRIRRWKQRNDRRTKRA